MQRAPAWVWGHCLFFLGKGYTVKSGMFAIALLAAACAPAPSGAQVEPVTSALDASSGRPVVSARINGQGQFPVILDTGAGANVLLASVAHELRLSSVGQVPLTSPFGHGPPVQGDLVLLDTIAISKLERHNEQAVVIPDNLLALRGARGVFSPGMFSDRVVEIDVSASSFWVGVAPRRAVTNWLPMGHAGLLQTQVVIGDVSIPADIDTGNAGVITLPASFVPRLALRGPLHESGGMRTIDAAIITSLGQLDTAATIAGLPVRINVAMFADVPNANVGLQGLKGFVVVLDNPHNRWALVGASSAPLEARSSLGTLGVHGMPELDGAVVVHGFDENSRAMGAGLRVGDRIVRVNGSPVALMNPDILRDSASTSGVRLGIERGGQVIEIAVS